MAHGMSHHELQCVVTAISNGRPGVQRRELLLIKASTRIGSAPCVEEDAVLVEIRKRSRFVSSIESPRLAVDVLRCRDTIRSPPGKQIFKVRYRRDGSIRIAAVHIHKLG